MSETKDEIVASLQEYPATQPTGLEGLAACAGPTADRLMALERRIEELERRGAPIGVSQEISSPSGLSVDEVVKLLQAGKR